MMDRLEILHQLVGMSRNLGQPDKDYVILGEGNTSARIDDATFWVKASGAQLHGCGGDSFVEMVTERVLAMLDDGDLSDEEVGQALAAAKLNPAGLGRPSVETMLHALALTLGNAQYVGHTHPTAVNAILCSQQAEQVVAGRLFPDEIVVCGPPPAFVPYTDPGLPLARRVRDVLSRYREEHGEPAKVILIQNHGLIALGRSAGEVENITAMCVKNARVLLGACALGGPRFLSDCDVQRIHTRPDELYRRQKLGQ